jgi:hypothetical protein
LRALSIGSAFMAAMPSIVAATNDIISVTPSCFQPGYQCRLPIISPGAVAINEPVMIRA